MFFTYPRALRLERKDLIAMKHWKQRSLACLLSALLLFALAGCGDSSDGSDTSGGSTEVEDVLYPVSIGDSEIRVGETTVQTLLDAGLNITFSEWNDDNQIDQYTVDPEMELEANSYYSGGTIWVSDSIYAHVSIVTDEDSVKLGEGVIARMEFSFPSAQDDPALATISFNGIPVTELNRDKAGEVFPDFTGDEVMWFSPAAMLEHKYFMSFNMEDGSMTTFSVEKTYDVDWSSAS